MISGSGPRGLALINGETFDVGEAHKLKIAEKKISLKCLEIHDKSVLAKVDGEAEPRELKLGETKLP